MIELGDSITGSAFYIAPEAIVTVREAYWNHGVRGTQIGSLLQTTIGEIHCSDLVGFVLFKLQQAATPKAEG